MSGVQVSTTTSPVEVTVGSVDVGHRAAGVDAHPGYLTPAQADGTYSRVFMVAPPTGVAVTDTAAIQAKVDEAEAAGGGIVELFLGTYMVSSSIVRPTGVVIRGKGRFSTVVKLADGANTDVFITDDYATLTGSGTWTYTSVPYGGGIERLTIDGNKANNISGCGIKSYAKGFTFHEVGVHSCAEDGIRTEGANTDLAISDHRQAPEAVFSNLHVHLCDGKGINFMGPHDSRLDNIFINGCQEEGFANSSPTNELGNCDIGFMHIYGCGLDGVSPGMTIGAQLAAEHLEIETSYHEGLVVSSSATIKIGRLELFRNWTEYAPYSPFLGDPALNPGTNYSLHITSTARGVYIDEVRVETNYGGSAILDENPNGTQLLDVELVGYSYGTDGYVSEQPRFTIKGRANGFTGAALRVGTAAALVSTTIDFYAFDCGYTLVTATALAGRNDWRIIANAFVGQTGWSLAGYTPNDRLHMVAFGGGTLPSTIDTSRGLFGTRVWNPAPIAAGATASATIVVTGAVVSDLVTGVSFTEVLPDGMLLAASVTAADTVTATLVNHTAGTVDLATGTLRALVVKRPS